MSTLELSRSVRFAYSMFPSGVAAVCGLTPSGEPVGMAMSSFTPVSLDPPLVSVCADRASTTWPRLAELPRLGVSILGAAHHAACAALSSKNGNRFANVSWRSTDSGAVLIDDSALWIECRIHAQFPGGDHWVVLLEAIDLVPHPDTPPLLFHRSALRAVPIGARD